MNLRRAVSVLLAATAATMLVTGSFGFTSVSADRGVSVAVVDSENAYVNVTACAKSNGNGSAAKPAQITVTNQFSERFVVDRISWGSSAHPSKKSKTPKGDEADIEAGEGVTYDGGFGDGEVTVEVSGGIDATVSVPVEKKRNCDRNAGNEDNGDDEDDNGDDNDD